MIVKRLFLFLALLMFFAMPVRGEDAPSTDAAAEELATLQDRFQKQFEDFYTKLERLADKLAENEPERAALCKSAVKYIRDHMVPESFKKAMEQIRSRKLNLALEEVSRLIFALTEVMAILEGTGNIDDRIKSLREHISKIEELIRRQTALLSETSTGTKPAPELAPQQYSIELDANELAGKMERDSFPESGSRVKEASASMSDATTDLRGEKRTDAARKQADAIDKLKEALDLANRAAELLEAIKRTKRLQELKKILEALLHAQRTVLETTVSVETAFATEKSLTRALKLKLTNAATSQNELNTTYNALHKGMQEEDGDGVFTYLLGKIVTDGSTVFSELSQSGFDSKAQIPQKAIILRLEAMINGIDELLKPGGMEEDGGAGGGGGGGSNQIVLPLAQLVALKAEQQDIAIRLQRQLELGDKADKAELERLRVRQNECAELLARMLEQAR